MGAVTPHYGVSGASCYATSQITNDNLRRARNCCIALHYRISTIESSAISANWLSA